ncbi:MAG: C39 family peptidase [Pseudomonadota bacterium]|nr:C39 family peptidase [Pseudomonadota bacterium]
MSSHLVVLALLAACIADSDRGGVVRATPGGGDGGEDDPADDTDDPEDTDDTASSGATGCTTLGPARARCGLATAADWAAGESAGLLLGDDLRLATTGLTAGTDTAGVYNGGAYHYGSFTSETLEPGIAFDGVVPSWNAATPAGTWISIQVQARVGGTWTAWYRLGVWASGDGTVDRHSFDGESDASGEVWTDTVALDTPADAVRIRATLFSEDGVTSPTLTRLALAFADTGAGRGTDAGGEAWGTALDVPARSQMVFDAGEAWCSPTSTSMLLAWWADRTGSADVTVPEAADGTWDHTYEGNGNWPFNVAYAATFGLAGEVAWFDAIDDLEPWLAAGVPVAISAAWSAGELDNAPISSTAGHLLVVTGFTDDGDVRVNDPASASDAAVPRTYDRRQIEAAWLGGSGGVVYLVWAGERPGP